MLVNGQRVLDMENSGTIDFNNLYVYVDVIKPGHHFYSVLDVGEDDRSLHRVIARNREEPIPPY